jgi:hypothetical protein
VWIGAGAVVSAGTREVAVRVGAAVNVWDTGTAAVADEHEVEVTWGGPVPGGPEAIGTRIQELAQAGATWVVCGWPGSLEDVAAARKWAGSGEGPG